MERRSSLEHTLSLIRSGKAKVGVIGLGYVGLPLAIVLAKKFRVLGYDSDGKKRRTLRSGVSYIEGVSSRALRNSMRRSLSIADRADELRECDCLIICVPTPVGETGNPDLGYVRHSAAIVRRIARKGMLVVLESTSYPGTTDEFLGEALVDAGFTPGKEVALAFSPERVDPGNKRYGISNTPKIVGGVNEASTEMAAELYSKIVEAGVVKVRDCATAEAVKMVENIFRGVNIALINEMSLIFERMGIDTWEVVGAASTKPFGFMPHYPGPGVGGHCIPLDSLYLSYKAKQYGFVPRFIELSRQVNEFMKFHTVNMTIAALKQARLAPRQATVGIMGLAYKKNISDTRESPAIDIIRELSKRVGRVVVHDPRASSMMVERTRFRVIPVDRILGEADCLVFLVDHDEYVKLPVERIRRGRVKAIVDGRNLFQKETVEKAGLVYKAIGKDSV